MRDRSHDKVMGESYRHRPLNAVGMFKALLIQGGTLGEWRIFLRHIRIALCKR